MTRGYFLAALDACSRPNAPQDETCVLIVRRPGHEEVGWKSVDALLERDVEIEAYSRTRRPAVLVTLHASPHTPCTRGLLVQEV